MRLLLCSDLHADLAAASSLVERSTSADVLVVAGDVGNLRRSLQPCVDVLSRARCPAVLVAGNNESVDELRTACRGWAGAVVLHGDAAVVRGVTFFGVGGGIPVTPFGAWSWDFTEEEAAGLLQGCPEGAVLVSHSPPRGACDRSSGGQSLGSRSVREAVLRARPALVVCGHIHGSAGEQAVLGGVPVVNAGPAGRWWDLPGPSG